jgi:hypothetical protein
MKECAATSPVGPPRKAGGGLSQGGHPFVQKVSVKGSVGGAIFNWGVIARHANPWRKLWRCVKGALILANKKATRKKYASALAYLHGNAVELEPQDRAVQQHISELSQIASPSHHPTRAEKNHSTLRGTRIRRSGSADNALLRTRHFHPNPIPDLDR